MVIRAGIRSFIYFIIPLILLILLPAASFADADRIFKENNKAVVVVVAYDEKGEAISQGSGFIVRADGAIVTNYHVISNAKNIKIKAGDKVLDIEGLILTDKENDLVILKAKGKDMPVVKLGDIGKVNIGEKVYVISSPEGLENTISDGLLSGIREIAPERKILQITASISSGSSGGPVFNKNGEVIGVATFIIKEAQNLNFAMPVDLIKEKINNKKLTALKGAGLEDYEKTAEYWFYLGFTYGEAGMYKEAIEAYKQAIRIEPDHANVHFNLGFNYYESRMHKEAIEAYKQAIRINPDDASAHNNLGIAYGDLGMHKESIEAHKQAIRINPDDASAHNNLGNVYAKSGMYKEAMEVYMQSIRIEFDNAAPHHNLGIVFYNLDMHKEAIEAFKQAIRIKPDYATAHNNLGVVYGKSDMHKEAIEAFKQAIRIKPDYATAHYNLGGAYIVSDDRSSALEEYKILKDLDTEIANKLFNEIYK